MMGEQTVMEEALFYEFSLERHVPAGQLVRAIDRFVDLSSVSRRERQRKAILLERILDKLVALVLRQRDRATLRRRGRATAWVAKQGPARAKTSFGHGQ